MSKRFERQVVELEQNEEVQFTAMTERFGRAEFAIGVERGTDAEIKALYLIPGQQPDKKDVVYKYVPNYDKQYGFSVESWGHKDVDYPRCWRTGYCEVHDLVEQHWYVPRQASKFKIREHSTGISVLFERGEALE